MRHEPDACGECVAQDERELGVFDQWGARGPDPSPGASLSEDELTRSSLGSARDEWHRMIEAEWAAVGRLRGCVLDAALLWALAYESEAGGPARDAFEGALRAYRIGSASMLNLIASRPGGPRG